MTTPSRRRLIAAVSLWPLLELTIVATGWLVGDAAGDAEAGVGVAVLVGFPLLGALAVRLRRSAFDARERVRLDARTIALGVALGIAGLGLALAASLADHALFGAAPEAEPYSPLAAALLLAGNAFVVPICEELYWRGYVLELMIARWPAAAAVGLSALAFSLKHVLVDAAFGRLLTLFTLGLVLALAYRRFGLGGSITAHVTANLAATALFLTTR